MATLMVAGCLATGHRLPRGPRGCKQQSQQLGVTRPDPFGPHGTPAFPAPAPGAARGPADGLVGAIGTVGDAVAPPGCREAAAGAWAGEVGRGTLPVCCGGHRGGQPCAGQGGGVSRAAPCGTGPLKAPTPPPGSPQGSSSERSPQSSMPSHRAPWGPPGTQPPFLHWNSPTPQGRWLGVTSIVTVTTGTVIVTGTVTSPSWAGGTLGRG